MKEDDIIATTLGLRPLASIDTDKELPAVQDEDEATEAQLPAVVDHANEEVIADIEHARQNIKNIITQGDDALAEMMELAKQSESPRAFEVASTLMKTLLDANKDFVEMSSKKKYAIEETKGGTQNQTNVTNNNLILSTADLLKMIKGEG